LFTLTSKSVKWHLYLFVEIKMQIKRIVRQYTNSLEKLKLTAKKAKKKVNLEQNGDKKKVLDQLKVAYT